MVWFFIHTANVRRRVIVRARRGAGRRSRGSPSESPRLTSLSRLVGLSRRAPAGRLPAGVNIRVAPARAPARAHRHTGGLGRSRTDSDICMERLGKTRI